VERDVVEGEVEKGGERKMKLYPFSLFSASIYLYFLLLLSISFYLTYVDKQVDTRR
jgi:hypothetical protein